MLGLFQDRKVLVNKYGVKARAMMADYGDHAEERARSRANQCPRGSRDFKHWDGLAKAIGYMNQ